MAVIEMDEGTVESENSLVGPIIRAGDLAEAVIDAIEADNPESDVWVLDRDDYVRIHTLQRCRLSQESLQRAYGQPIQLAALEIDMPAFKGRMSTRTNEYTWFYSN